MNTATDNDPLAVLRVAFWGPLPGSPGGGVDAEQLARKALFALQDAGLVVKEPNDTALSFEQAGSFMLRLIDLVPDQDTRQAVLTAVVEEFGMRLPQSPFSAPKD